MTDHFTTLRSNGLNQLLRLINLEHFKMAASASMFYIAIDFNNERNMKVAASNINRKIHQAFSIEHTCDNNHKINLDLFK